MGHETKNKYKKRFKNCEQNFKEKLFLTSFDLMTLNISSRLLFQAYLLFDFVFVVYYPLNNIFNHSVSSVLTTGNSLFNILSNVVGYLNPADKIFDLLPYELNEKIEMCLIVYAVIALSLLVSLIFTRNKKKLNITSQKKFLNKLIGLVITMTNFFLFVPILSYNSRIFYCSNNENVACYTGIHLAILLFAVLAFIIQFVLIFYSSSLMTCCYPNETIPWSHFPSKVPFFKIMFKITIILVYQGDSKRVIIPYANIIFFLCLALFIYQRLTNSQTFDRGVHNVYVLTEAMQLVIFFVAFLTDVLIIELNYMFCLVFLLAIIGVIMFVWLMKNRAREKFLHKIDIFNYKYETEAMHMMIALHELIETSQFEEKDEFLLRGFVERHIEICDFPDCNCLEYYKVINSTYRIQLATVATMKEDENNKSSISNNQAKSTFEDETTQDDNSMQKTFFVKAKSIVKQNKQRTKFMNQFLINNIKVFLELFPNSIKLRYMSAFIYFNLFKNSFKALYELSYTKTLKSSFGESYDSYTLGLKIIQYFGGRVNQFLSKENKILDIEIDLKQIIEFEKLNIRYQKNIEQTSETAESFWLELNKKNVNIDNIFKLGCTINGQFHQIKKKYKKLMSINNNYLEVAYLYKLFVSLCLNYELEESEAKMDITKILQAKGMRKKNLRQEYCKINFSDENGMIIISGCQKDFSKILAMNNKAERIFGYNTDELINHTLTKLLPLVYGYNHDDFILNYINSKRKIRKDNHSFVWGKHKSGFIMPIIMDISPYVTFEYNLCFIAFCKRSILLEMNPLKEILDAQDVFVLLADQRGVITDMTRNITEWLGFPLQALNKEISLEQIFDGILEDELEKEFQDGKKLDFFMNSFKDALDDFENRSEDEFESTLYTKEKKCRALVWMKIHEHQLLPMSFYQSVNQGGLTIQGGGSGLIGAMAATASGVAPHQQSNLVVRELWFVLLEEEANTATATASFLDTKNTHESGMDKEELKFTYQEDREEICSLASVSSLAGYGSFDKGLINKLSEIKNSTVDETKPRSISILQKALVLVFLLTVASAIIIISFAISKSQQFFTDLQMITDSKMSAIGFQNIQILTRELVNIANLEQDNNCSVINGSLSLTLKDMLYNQTDDFRNSEQQLSNSTVILPDNIQLFQEKNVSLIYIRSDGLLYRMEKTSNLAFYEVMINAYDLSLNSTLISALSLDRSYLQMASSFSASQLQTQIKLDSHQRLAFFTLANTINSGLSFYPMIMSDLRIQRAQDAIAGNRTLFIAITFIAISITFVTAVFIIPIILRIESNKEKVFFIYAELNKNDIDDRKRNIRIFFAKLRQSTNNPGGSLFYQKSSRIVSSRLLTKKFSMKDETAGPISLPMPGLQRQQPIGQITNGTTSASGQNIIDKNNGDIEEDMRAELMKQQEELEAAVFKRFFHRKIKKMSCLKKLKYIFFVLLFSALVTGYFLLSNSMITTIDNSIIQSLDYYEIISQRDPILSILIANYREQIARNQTLHVVSGVIDNSDNTTIVGTVNEFVERVLKNEQLYNNLRQNLPDILLDSSSIISTIEGTDLCSIMATQSDNDNCQVAMNGILKQGMTQTINTIVMQIVQGQIDFSTSKLAEKDLKVMINNLKIRDLIYLKLLYLDQALYTLIQSAQSSIETYFQALQKNLIIAFACFVVIMMIAVVVCTTIGMDFLYKNFNATKSILNLIPGKCLIELSEKADLKKIQF